MGDHFRFLSERSFSGDRDSAAQDSLFSGYEYDDEFEMLVNAFLRDMNYTSLSQAAWNIVYATINVGLVALPFTAQESGIPLYVGVLVLVAVIASYTSVMVIAIANEQRVRTLEDLAECAFGPRGFFAVSAFQILYSFSLMCITLDVWADIMTDTLAATNINNYMLRSHVGQAIIGATLVLPLCIFKKSMSTLRWTSYVTVFAVVAGLLAIVATYFTDKNMNENMFPNHSAENIIIPKKQWWSLVFISGFCYSSNQKVLTIYSSLRRRSIDRWTSAVRRAMISVTLLYLLFGICGYLAKNRESIRLDNFNYFVDDSDEIKVVFDPARYVTDDFPSYVCFFFAFSLTSFFFSSICCRALVAFSLLLTIPVDCLVASTTWRRLRSKYSRAKLPPSEPEIPDDVGKTMENTALLDSSGLEENMAESRRSVDRRSSRSVSHRSRKPPAALTAAIPKPPVIKSKSLKSATTGSEGHTPAKDNEGSKSHSSWSLLSSIQQLYGDKDKSGKSSPSSGGLGGPRETDSLTDSNSEEATIGQHSSPDNAKSTSELPSESFPPQQYFNSHDHSSDGIKRVNTPEATQHIGLFEDEELDVDTPEVPSLWPTKDEAIPAIMLWVLCLGVSVGIQHWLYIAATIGTVSVVMLMFIFPSMLYFKLGLLTDYQANPLCGDVVPNRVYMTCVQLLGMAILVFDIGAIICFVATGQRVVQDES